MLRELLVVSRFFVLYRITRKLERSRSHSCSPVVDLLVVLGYSGGWKGSDPVPAGVNLVIRCCWGKAP